ncbi:hypothetical protein SH501x_002764 [Pirellulaceae bacterium SH501]
MTMRLQAESVVPNGTKNRSEKQPDTEVVLSALWPSDRFKIRVAKWDRIKLEIAGIGRAMRGRVRDL